MNTEKDGDDRENSEWQRVKPARRQAHILTARLTVQVAVEVTSQVPARISPQLIVAITRRVILPTSRQEAIQVGPTVPVQLARELAAGFASPAYLQIASQIASDIAVRTTPRTVPGTVPTVVPRIIT